MTGGRTGPGSLPRIAPPAGRRRVRWWCREGVADGCSGKETDMWLIVLEALGAGALLVGIVWWTMFSGRRGGERIDDDRKP